MNYLVICRRWIVSSAVGGFLFGCTSIPSNHGRTVGDREDAELARRLVVNLHSSQSRVRRGDPITFDVEIRNEWDQPLWLPRDLSLVLMWTYPTGQKDNTMGPMVAQGSFGWSSLQQLESGQVLSQRVSISTRYFPRLGVTKFWAMVQVPSNTAAIALPVGRYVSNRVDIQVTE